MSNYYSEEYCRKCGTKTKHVVYDVSHTEHNATCLKCGSKQIILLVDYTKEKNERD